jgi:hypothetical protein
LKRENDSLFKKEERRVDRYLIEYDNRLCRSRIYRRHHRTSFRMLRVQEGKRDPVSQVHDENDGMVDRCAFLFTNGEKSRSLIYFFLFEM